VLVIRNALLLAAMCYGLMNLWIEADKTQGHRLTNTFWRGWARVPPSP